MTLELFEKQLKLARTMSELDQALQKYLASLKITTFAFTYYSYYPNSLNKIKYDICSPNFEIWHKHYLEENYEEIDTTLEKVYRKSLPEFWDLQKQLKEARTPKEKQMRLDSIEFGAEKGLSIPIHGPHEDFAILLVVQMRGEHCLAEWQKIQYDLFAAGYYYYSYLQPILLKHQEPAEKFDLSKREIQCLLLIAKNFSMKAIAENLHLTERTVNYHIQRLNKKLGTKNKYQSVAKALQYGLIKI
jgi:DNA-binding CsgD family transcriptional regulator